MKASAADRACSPPCSSGTASSRRGRPRSRGGWRSCATTSGSPTRAALDAFLTRRSLRAMGRGGSGGDVAAHAAAGRSRRGGGDRRSRRMQHAGRRRGGSAAAAGGRALLGRPRRRSARPARRRTQDRVDAGRGAGARLRGARAGGGGLRPGHGRGGGALGLRGGGRDRQRGLRMGIVGHRDAQRLLAGAARADRGAGGAAGAGRGDARVGAGGARGDGGRRAGSRARRRSRREAAAASARAGERCSRADEDRTGRMLLTPTELERLTIFTAAMLARRRRDKGLLLNHPEAVAIIADEILEGRGRGKSVADLISFGSTILTSDDVMPGVPAMLPLLQVEGTFPDGTKLVSVHDPIRPGSVRTPRTGDSSGRDHPRRGGHRAYVRGGRGSPCGPPTRAIGRSRSAATFTSSRRTGRWSSIGRRPSGCTSTFRPGPPFASSRATPRR